MISEINHIALFVSDVEQSIKFYSEIIGLKQIPRPSFDFPGAWFQIGLHQQLHLIGLRNQEEDIKFSQSRGNHFALKVSSYRQAEEMLKSRNADFFPPRKRPDGAMQIFLKDPDGYFIELVETVD